MVQLGERDGGLGRRDLDVGGEEMAAVVEAVCLDVGHVGVHNGNADVALAFVVGLDVEMGRNFRDSAVDKFTRLDVARTKGERDVEGGIDGGKDVRYDIHLGDALHDDHAVVLAPLFVGEVAVNGLVHVAWIESVMSPGRVTKGHDTLAVLKPSLDHGIVDVCVNLELVQVTFHAVDAVLVPLFILRFDSLSLQSGNSLALGFDILDLLFTVMDQDFAGFLETLVGQLLKRDARAGEDGGTASARTDGSETTGTEEFALGSGRKDIVLGERRGRRRLCRRCSSGGWSRGGDDFFGDGSRGGKGTSREPS